MLVVQYTVAAGDKCTGSQTKKVRDIFSPLVVQNICLRYLELHFKFLGQLDESSAPVLPGAPLEFARQYLAAAINGRRTESVDGGTM
jgi:hypothetical protein